MIVISLYDLTGIAVEPWAKAGYECFCFDIQHKGIIRKSVGRGSITFAYWDADASNYLSQIKFIAGDKAYMVFGFPPCDDLAGCGAKHWYGKAQKDPEFQKKAALRAKKVERVAEELQCSRYVIENPSGALSRLWRKWNFTFHPCFYGGYLPKRDKHPTYSEYIPPRDAYRKLTCLWAGADFIMPKFKKIAPEILKAENGKSFNRQTKKLGGRSLKTKNIRSATPRGWSLAVFLANRI